jgi:hypothetical protein
MADKIVVVLEPLDSVAVIELRGVLGRVFERVFAAHTLDWARSDKNRTFVFKNVNLDLMICVDVDCVKNTREQKRAVLAAAGWLYLNVKTNELTNWDLRPYTKAITDHLAAKNIAVAGIAERIAAIYKPPAVESWVIDDATFALIMANCTI